MSSERILVTGGTGFVGTHLVEFLLGATTATISVASQSGKSSFFDELSSDRVSVHALDLGNAEETLALVKSFQPTQVYHLASLASVSKSHQKSAMVLTQNTLLQYSILEAVRVAAPKAKILSVGSAEQYGINQDGSEALYTEKTPFSPVSPYGVSKITQEMLSVYYQQAHGLSILRTRAFNHIGERQSTEFAIPAFITRILAAKKEGKQTIATGNMTAIRDISDVKDVVSAYYQIMEQGQVGAVYNVGSGVGNSMQDVLETLIELIGVPIKPVQDQALFRPLDVPCMIADNKKIIDLGWKQKHSLQETLSRTVQWYTERHT